MGDPTSASIGRAAAGLLSLAVFGCYHHQGSGAASSARPIPARPALVGPVAGTYRITRGGREIGEERFRVATKEGRWVAEGTVRLTEPSTSTHGYRLEIDEVAGEPVRFEVWVELFGLRRRAVGLQEAGFFRVEVDGVGPRRSRRIPYALGTAIGFDSPLFASFVLALLKEQMKAGSSIAVRTILVELPELASSVRLLEYVPRPPSEEGLRRVVVRHLRTGASRALWVRADGLPVRVRTFSPTGELLRERRLVVEE